MRIDEINTRLAAIANEIDSATGEALTALETETANLLAERQQIESEIQTRQQLRDKVAAGIVTGNPIEDNKEEKKMENRTFNTASPEYRSAFLKTLRRETLNEVEQRAFTFLTTNTAAPLPEVMQNRIIDLIGEDHPIVADVYTLNSGTTITIPVGKTIAADAGKSVEGDAGNELEIEFSDVTLAGDDFTGTVKVSYKMMHMAIDAFEDYLVTKVSERLGAKLAADIVANIKAGMNAANKVATGVTFANIAAGFGALKRVGKVMVYGTRETIYNKVVGMVDSNKRPIFMQSITAEAAGHILGGTIKFEDAMGAGELLIGDPKKYLQNVVAPIILDQGKDLENHKVLFSGYTCQEGELTDDKAFALVSEA